jgi:7-carboxy-7-deazaguanine synthase
MSVEQVVAEVRANGFRTVLVTGGEPLLQEPVVELMATLQSEGRTVLLETSGTHGPANTVTLDRVPAGVHRIVDIKAPGSGIPADLIDWQGVSMLGEGDEVKFVCTGRRDYEWSRDLLLAGDRVPAGVAACFSPVQGELEPRELAGWILDDRLDACFQIQLHKAVWPDVARGV